MSEIGQMENFFFSTSVFLESFHFLPPFRPLECVPLHTKKINGFKITFVCFFHFLHQYIQSILIYLFIFSATCYFYSRSLAAARLMADGGITSRSSSIMYTTKHRLCILLNGSRNTKRVRFQFVSLN